MSGRIGSATSVAGAAFTVALVTLAAQAPLPAVTWEPVVTSTSIAPTNELFPAQILALGTSQPAGERPDARYLGSPSGTLGVVATSSAPGATVRVSIRVDRFAAESTLSATLADAHRQYEIWPEIRFDARALAQLREPLETTASFSVVVNGTAVGAQTRRLRLRAVNDVPFAYSMKSGAKRDISYLFAAFVDEDNPAVDSILRRALSANVVQAFKGYQGPPEEGEREVFAIWNVLQRDGVKYSGIPAPSNRSKVVVSQRVRFPDETMRDAQANCVDASVLFASVLYKLGILPVLVRVPGHMFLGFFTDALRHHSEFLETTWIGRPGLRAAQRFSTFVEPRAYRDSESYRQFQRAIAKGAAEFQDSNRRLLTGAPGYVLIDVDEVRRSGFSIVRRD